MGQYQKKNLNSNSYGVGVKTPENFLLSGINFVYHVNGKRKKKDMDVKNYTVHLHFNLMNI
jgi:hypothetical protein